jgi:hypothetical protein
MECTDN